MVTAKGLFSLTRLGHKLRYHIPEIVCIGLIFVIWQLVSETLPNFIMPSPLATLQETYRTLFSADFIYNASLTLKRSLIGFFAAFFLAHILIFSGIYSEVIERFWQPLILITLAIPATIGVFISVVILGSRGPVALYVAVLILTPIIYLMLQPIYKNLDKDLTEMSQVYRFSQWEYLKYIVVPQVAPYYLSAIRAGVNDAWKLTILAEVFSFGNGAGHQILQYFNLFSIRQVLAWFLSFFIILIAIEYGIFRPLEKLLPTNSIKKLNHDTN